MGSVSDFENGENEKRTAEETDSLSEAKKMYFDSGCSTFIMLREDEYEKFESFGVSARMLEEWEKEYVDGLLDKLDAEKSLKAFGMLSCFARKGDAELLGRLYEFFLEERNADPPCDRAQLCASMIDSIGPFQADREPDLTRKIADSVYETLLEVINGAPTDLGTLRLCLNTEKEVNELRRRIAALIGAPEPPSETAAAELFHRFVRPPGAR